MFHAFSKHPKNAVPKLIVFDLDNTLWTPELYTLRRRTGSTILQRPLANVHVHLFPGAKEILQQIREYQNDGQQQQQQQQQQDQNPTDRIQFAIASRTKSMDWAHDLLHQFQIHDLFTYIEIFPADKKQHFDNLHRTSHISYHNMIFFDDARDGKYGNCVSVAELGVLAVHCPVGLHNIDLFQQALRHYQNFNENHTAITTSTTTSTTTTTGSRSPTIIESDGTMTCINTTHTIDGNQLQKNAFDGYVHVVYYNKRYGFIRCHQDRRSIFFHFNNILPATTKTWTGNVPASQRQLIQQGDIVSFNVIVDEKSNNKPAAHNIVIQRRSDTRAKMTSTTTNTNDTGAISLRCFSMNMPFAALLANRYKTLESRNGTMFVPYPEGTILLLQVGQRTYPDGDRHLDIMKRRTGWSDEQIEQDKSLPDGYQRGMVIAICQIGKTIEMSLEQRSVPEIEQQIVALGSDSGKMITEIKLVQYLKRPLLMPAQGGIYKVSIPIDVIPDEFIELLKPQQSA